MTPQDAAQRQMHFADLALSRRAGVIANDLLARDTYRLRLQCPEIARRIVPGQFVMLRWPDTDDPLLGRAFALYDTYDHRDDRPAGIDVGYVVVGKLTGRLAQLTVGDEVEVWGPLGNGFPPQACEHLVMVAGGIGQTPFVALAGQTGAHRGYGRPFRSVRPAERITLLYGVRCEEYLAAIDDFKRYGVEVQVSTDDGSAGHHGMVTDLLTRLLSQQQAGIRVVCCGPEPMMAAVSKICSAAGMPCQVSLETPMACGIGACFSCVARIRQSAGDWDYRRTCVEGPVFAGQDVVW